MCRYTCIACLHKAKFDLKKRYADCPTFNILPPLPKALLPQFVSANCKLVDEAKQLEDSMEAGMKAALSAGHSSQAESHVNVDVAAQESAMLVRLVMDTHGCHDIITCQVSMAN